MHLNPPQHGPAPTADTSSPNGNADVGAEEETAPHLDGYRYVRPIGSGRHTRVHLYEHQATGREFAIKVGAVAVPDRDTRLSAHTELLAAGAAARHPCALTVLDAGFTPDHRPYLISHHCPGGSAQDRLEADGPLPLDQVLVIGIRMALALHASHRRGILHLNLRPANILFDDRGEALLADHGITRVLQRCCPQLGALFDPLHTAREMFGWQPPGPAADVYSLGSTLHSLLTGQPPRTEADSPPEPPDLPSQLATLLHRMVSDQPETRPPLTEIHHVLRQQLPDEHPGALPDLAPQPAPEPPLPGWDPDEDRDPAQEESGRQSRTKTLRAAAGYYRHYIAAGALAALVVAGTATALLLTHHKNAPPHTARSTAPPQPAKQVPTKDLSALQPQHITITRSGSSYQISWQEPTNSRPVIGYRITATTPDGHTTLSTKNTSRDERQQVFVSPPVQRNSCYIVTSLISRSSDAQFQLAPAEPQCDTE